MIRTKNGEIIPQDFINRHGDVVLNPGFEFSTCQCGADFPAIGRLHVVVKSVAFNKHLAQAFRRYKLKHRQLIGGDVSG